jgi:Asp-tRNA(Asn)/Glu-tRNA(Gln) amidotransferase A subunit family amidase
VETNDLPTTNGSALFADFISPRNATIVDKIESAGGIVIAKATMGEFASGYAGSAFGFCRNVYDLSRSPAGSSCGTGIGVAASFATVGIAEDTGGSTRGPAAVGNAVGLRPTTPLISRFGLFPASPSRDTLGPLTRTVEDTAILLDVIAGYDPNDPITAYSIGNIPTTYTASLLVNGLKGMRIGVIREPISTNAEPESEDYAKVKTVIDASLADLRALGAEVIDPVTIPELKSLLDRSNSNYETEVAVNDYLAQLPNSPIKTFREIATSNLIVPTRRASLIEALNRTPEDPAHLAALAARSRLRVAVLKVMADNQLDALVYATFDQQPPLIPSDLLTNPNAETASRGSNTRLSPFLGFPALTVPAGFTTDKLPVGLEFLGLPFAESTLIQLGYGYEQGTMHRQPPSTTPPLP